MQAARLPNVSRWVFFRRYYVAPKFIILWYKITFKELKKKNPDFYHLLSEYCLLIGQNGNKKNDTLARKESNKFQN